jgi:hypothetical protein
MTVNSEVRIFVAEELAKNNRRCFDYPFARLRVRST